MSSRISLRSCSLTSAILPQRESLDCRGRRRRQPPRHLADVPRHSNARTASIEPHQNGIVTSRTLACRFTSGARHQPPKRKPICCDVWPKMTECWAVRPAHPLRATNSLKNHLRRASTNDG
jgi:hypothetical protein